MIATLKANKITDTFKILSDPTRLQILHLLFYTKDELCVGEIADAVGISHSAASHQLDKLASRNIVQCTRKGQMMCYTILDNSLTNQLKKTISLFTH